MRRETNNFSVIVNVLKDESMEAEGLNAKCKRRSFKKVLIKVTVRCGCVSEIEGMQLVREKVKVVVNQSSTIGNLAS